MEKPEDHDKRICSLEEKLFLWHKPWTVAKSSKFPNKNHKETILTIWICNRLVQTSNSLTDVFNTEPGTDLALFNAQLK